MAELIDREGVPESLLISLFNAVAETSPLEPGLVVFGTVGWRTQMCVDATTLEIVYAHGLATADRAPANTTLAHFNAYVLAVAARFPFYSWSHGMDDCRQAAAVIERDLERIEPVRYFWQTVLADIRTGAYATEEVLSWG